VAYITKLRGVSKIDLLGWSAGTQRAGLYVMQHPERVARLILYAPTKEEDLLPFFSELGTRDKQFVVLPHGGHALLLEKDHRRFQREVLSFFDQAGGSVPIPNCDFIHRTK
jgi:pimeloyl-ACP methyl ester carboxylesterase